METINVTDLLLRTAFSCMACDGDIAPEEIELIRELALKDVLFGTIDIDNALISLTDEINKKGKGFLKSYLIQLANAELTKEDEINILRIAAKTIQADNKIEYSEIKFFKIIRSNLKLDDQYILENVKEIDNDYLAQDIKADYMQIYTSYFDMIELPQFKTIDLDIKLVHDN